MSASSWVCAQVSSKAGGFRQGLEWLASSEEEAAVATKNTEIGILCLPFVQRL